MHFFFQISAWTCSCCTSWQGQSMGIFTVFQCFLPRFCHADVVCRCAICEPTRKWESGAGQLDVKHVFISCSKTEGCEGILVCSWMPSQPMVLIHYQQLNLKYLPYQC